MKERLYVIVFVVLLGLVAAALLTVANSVLFPKYEQNVEREAKGNVLIALSIPGWDKARVKTATIEEIKATFDKYIVAVPAEEKPDFYMGYELKEDGTKGDLVGYAFKITGAGFWDRISGFLAVDPEVEKVIGITFYEDAETPGLGHKINEPEWQATWVGRSIYRPGTDEPWIGITPVRRDKPANEVDAISGATETSGAVQKFLNKQLKEFVEKVKAYKAGQ